MKKRRKEKDWHDITTSATQTSLHVPKYTADGLSAAVRTTGLPQPTEGPLLPVPVFSPTPTDSRRGRGRGRDLNWERGQNECHD